MIYTKDKERIERIYYSMSLVLFIISYCAIVPIFVFIYQIFSLFEARGNVFIINGVHLVLFFLRGVRIFGLEVLLLKLRICVR